MVIFNSYVKLPEGSEFVSLQIGFFSESRMWIFKWAVTQGRGCLMGSWSTVDGCEIPRKPVENGGLSSHYFALWLQWLWFIGNISIVDGVYKPIYRLSSISGGAGFRWPIHSTSIGVYSLFAQETLWTRAGAYPKLGAPSCWRVVQYPQQGHWDK